jgi:hypothetical protein
VDVAASVPVLPGPAAARAAPGGRDVEWSRGDGLELHGPVESLLLVSTGRPAGLDDLDGPGLELARERFGVAIAGG